ncbi:hypothetical protein [Massilia sp. METH4]|uniref:hypothetical protein n=1 Tax=Massilia sp. METH4 TaxID=3123041 RepID=UPI0030D3CF34
MSFEDEELLNLLNHYPRDFTFRGKVLAIFPLAMHDFNALSKGNWPLDNYKISLASAKTNRMRQFRSFQIQLAALMVFLLKWLIVECIKTGWALSISIGWQTLLWSRPRI